MVVQAYKTKQGKRYQASFKHLDQRITQAGFKRIDEAKAWIADEKRRIATPPPVLPATPETFVLICTKYLDYCEGRLTPNMIRQKTLVARMLIGHLGYDPPISELTRTQISDYLTAQKKERGHKAANDDLKHLKAFFNRAIREEWISGPNPCSKIDPYSVDVYIRYVPPAEDINAVLVAAQPWEMELLQVYYHTAGRLSEILALTWEDVNFERRWVRLFTCKRRGGAREPRLMPMNDVLADVLGRKWKERDKESPFAFTNPLTHTRYFKNQSSIRKMMGRLCAKAGVKPFSIHAIRHHVASILQDSKKATLKQLQLFLGHKRQTTTEIYLHGLESKVAEMGAILDKVTYEGYIKNVLKAKREG